MLQNRAKILLGFFGKKRGKAGSISCYFKSTKGLVFDVSPKKRFCFLCELTHKHENCYA